MISTVFRDVDCEALSEVCMSSCSQPLVRLVVLSTVIDWETKTQSGSPFHRASAEGLHELGTSNFIDVPAIFLAWRLTSLLHTV